MSTMTKRTVVSLTDEELERLLDFAAKNSRDSLILRLLARTGVRLGELYGVYNKEQDEWLHGLQKKHIDFRNKCLWVYTVQRKKFVKRKVLVENDAIMDSLKDHTKAMNPEDYIFRDFMTYHIFEQLPRKYSRHAKIQKHVSPRSLRNAYVRGLLKKGVDIRQIQYLTGLRDVDTALLYTNREK